MRRGVKLLLILWILLLVSAPAGRAEEVYYARCNLKVLEGNEITWINWQAAPTFLPVGTKLQVTRKGSKATLVSADTKATYTLDIGADGEAFLEKFVTTRPVDISQFPENVQENIRKAIAKV
ncbi:MAG TPA: hypothetical protein VLT62_15050, partial [Candidatus Methylomirabilis sp.]|nr:hypothetical protein [Candidatus Methylomirabilis sp.]